MQILNFQKKIVNPYRIIYVSKERRKKDVVDDTTGHYDHYVVNQRYHLTFLFLFSILKRKLSITDNRIFFENLNWRLAHDCKDVVLDSI